MSLHCLSYTSVVDNLCYLCLMFFMLSSLFINALWSSAGKELTSWLMFLMFTCVLSLSYVVSSVRVGNLIVSIPDHGPFSYCTYISNFCSR